LRCGRHAAAQEQIPFCRIRGIGALPTRASTEARLAFDISDEIMAGVGDGEVLLLSASGEIDFAVGPLLRERLFTRIGAGHRCLVLDLSAVTFIDSMAIGVLVGAVLRLRETGGGSLSVVCASDNERVLRIFDIAGVANLIALHRTREDAFAELASAARAEVGPWSQEGPVGDSLESQVRSGPSRLGVSQRYVESEAMAGRPRPAGSRGDGHGARGRGIDELA
jgi:anti-sigma B factor antagonist